MRVVFGNPLQADERLAGDWMNAMWNARRPLTLRKLFESSRMDHGDRRRLCVVAHAAEFEGAWLAVPTLGKTDVDIRTAPADRDASPGDPWIAPGNAKLGVEDG